MSRAEPRDSAGRWLQSSAIVTKGANEMAPTWREPMKKRRCIIPANAFYEWSKVSPPLKQLYTFEVANGNLRALRDSGTPGKTSKATGSSPSPS